MANTTIDLDPGLQMLHGQKALQYVRLEMNRWVISVELNGKENYYMQSIKK